MDLQPSHLETIKKILGEHVPNAEVRAFGSRVNGRPKPHSDLDLVVVGKEDAGKAALRRIEEAFEESDLPFRVDVLDWNRISAEFKAIINSKYEVIQPGREK